MASLDLSNPQEPGFRYTSGGGTVSYKRECNCPGGAGQQACLDECAAGAQAVLDASLEVFPED